MDSQHMDFSGIEHFDPSEFSEDPRENAHRDLILALDIWRGKYGQAIEPSKAKGALARFETGAESYHYANPSAGIYSRACDVFPRGSIKRAWVTAMSVHQFGGIGLYFCKRDNRGNEAPMMHVDIRRGERVLWYWTPEEEKVFILRADHAMQRFFHLLGKYA